MISYCSGIVGLQHIKTDAAGAVTPQNAAGTSIQWPWAAADRTNPMLGSTSPVESVVGARLPAQSSNKRVIRSVVTGAPMDGLVSFPYVNFGTDTNGVQTFLSQPTLGGMAAGEMSIWAMQGADASWTGWFAEFGDGRALCLARGLVIGGGLSLPADIDIPQGAKWLMCLAHYRQASAAGTLPVFDRQAIPRIAVPVVLCIDG